MIKLLQWVTRIAGILALLLGMSRWAGPGIGPLGLHMALGGLVVLALATLAIWALIDRVRIAPAIVGLLWAAATLAVGTVQDWWVGGGSHLTIEIIHPLLGVGAIGLAEMLAAALTRRRASLV